MALRAAIPPFGESTMLATSVAGWCERRERFEEATLKEKNRKFIIKNESKVQARDAEAGIILQRINSWMEVLYER